MSEAPPAAGLRRLFAEMKRRRVFRVAAVYGATVFVVLQVADILVPALHLSDAVTTTLAVVSLLLFPVALVLAWALEVTPEGVKRTAPAAEGELEELVAEPAARRWPAGVLALIGIAALAGGSWLALRGPSPEGAAAADGSGATAQGAQAAPAAGRPGEEAAPGPRPSLAVLPFRDLSAEGDLEYLGAGLAEELLETLGGLSELRVAGRTSSFALAGPEADAARVAGALNVTYVLDGSVRREGERLRIAARLSDGRSGFQIWSESYDRRLESVIALQEEIAAAIARALRLPLRVGTGERSPASRTADPEAYDLYLRARFHLNDRDLGRALDLLQRAVRRDSGFAPAFGGLAEAYALFPYYALGTWSEYLPRAEAAARRALELDPSLASAHTALANVLRDRWQWRDAETEYRRALELSPDNAETLDQYGQFFLNTGRFERAARLLEEARDLDPLAANRHAMLGWTLFSLGRREAGVEALERAVALDPEFFIARTLLMLASLSTGDVTRAEEVARETGSSGAWPTLVRGAAGGPERSEAQRILREWRRTGRLEGREVGDCAWEDIFALWYPYLEADRDSAVAALEVWADGVGATAPALTLGWEAYHGEPRYEAVIARLRLPPGS